MYFNISKLIVGQNTVRASQGKVSVQERRTSNVPERTVGYVGRSDISTFELRQRQIDECED
jgi:hypothetical protein